VTSIGKIHQRRISDRQPGEPLIRVRGARKAYSTAAGEFLALAGIDFTVAPGELIGILGKSGAGKTTLVNLITATDRLTAGEIWVGDVAVHKLRENSAAAWRGKNLGVVYQSFHLIPSLSLLQNVMLAMDFNGNFAPRRSREFARELLAEMEIAEHADKLPGDISGGQQQRVAIARAMVNKPDILFADEPCANLDTESSRTVLDLFHRINEEQDQTIVMVSHEDWHKEYFHRIIRLRDGKIVEDTRKK
jgi:putative ABC transport system ATP-binding protein